MSVSKRVEEKIEATDSATPVLRQHIATIENMIRSGNINTATLAQGRREIFAQDRAVRALMVAYRSQYTELDVTTMAFNRLGGTINRLQGMYTMFNVAQIRQQQLQRTIREEQLNYNQAVAMFGPNSEQAIEALNQMKQAQQELVQVQIQNTMQMIGFVLQLPGMMRGIIDTVNAFKVLGVVMQSNTFRTQQATIATQAYSASVRSTAIGNIAALNAETAATQNLSRARMLLNLMSGPAGWAMLAGGVAAAAMIPMMMQGMDQQSTTGLATTQTAQAGPTNSYDMRNINIYGDMNFKTPMDMRDAMDNLAQEQRERATSTGVTQNQRAG